MHDNIKTVLKDNFWFLLISTIFLLGSVCSPKASAKCLQHTVIKGETLRKISKRYYKDSSHWYDIRLQNHLKRNVIRPGQQLNIYIPDTNDWTIACENIFTARINRLASPGSDISARNIIDGILLANKLSGNTLTPVQKLEACRWAIVTAQQESNFEFSIGSAGEVGSYQFKLDTVRLMGERYKILYLAEGSDKALVRILLKPIDATAIFVLHFMYLHKKYNSLWLAWRKYNSGSEADAYASKAMQKYQRVKEIVPIRCSI